MSNAKTRVTAAAVAILLLVSTVCAQGQNPASGARSNTTVTAAAAADRVRFTAPATVVQMRLEVYAASGVKVFDNEIRGGNVIDWLLQDGQAARLSDGSYLCVITTKSLSGRISQKLGQAVVQNTTAVMQPIEQTQLTAQQTQAVGPLEENASLTIMNEGESQTTTVIAHDGTDGQITRGRGALSFRIGDFFSGKDSEQMRLTEEGNLGIGTSDPKVKLDVAGMIGARDGLMFSDGSTLNVNRKGVLTHTTSKGDVVPSASATGTQNKLAKWTDNSGTLGDSAIVDVNGDIGIGTTTPQSGLDYRNGFAAFFTRDLPTNPGNAISALQLGLSNVGSRNAGVGPSFLFFGENSGGTKSFLGRVSGIWENPTAGAEAGAIFFQVRANSADVNALTERMRINSIGNVGIGTTTPEHRMSIAGGPAWTADNWGGAVALQNASAIGWQTNASGNRYGIGHTTAGLAFFRTASNLGTTGNVATYDMRIDNNGNVGIGNISLASALTSKLEIFAQNGMRISGFQPFLTLLDTNGGNKSSFVQAVNGDAVLLTDSRAALTVKDITGSVGIGTTTPNAKLHVVAGATNAVYASSTSGAAIYGDSLSTASNAIGVFGASDTTGTGTGVEGVGGQGGVGVRGIGEIGVEGLATVNNGIGIYGGRVDGLTNWDAGFFDGHVWIQNDLTVFGNFHAYGDKEFVEPHPTDPTKMITYVCLEGPEAGTYFRGSGRIKNGSAIIEVPEDFRMVSDEKGITIQVTPMGEPATIWCVRKSLDEIELRASADVEFDFMVNGVRRASKDHKPIVENTIFVPRSADDNRFRNLNPEAVRRLKATGILNQDGSVNMGTVQKLDAYKRLHDQK